MKTIDLYSVCRQHCRLKAASHQSLAKRRRDISFFVLPIMFLLVLSLISGCKAEEELPTIKPWQENAPAVEVLKLRVENMKAVEEEPDTDGVELKGVGFAADGSYIMVSFTAPPLVAENWWEDSIFVIDEETGAIYKEIPVMPKIGPLIGKPKEAGQLGYAMIINHNFGIQPDSVVTVVLGNYKRVHVQIQYESLS